MSESLLDVTTNAVADIALKAEQQYAELFKEVTLSKYLSINIETISDADLESALTGIPHNLFQMGNLISEAMLKRDTLKKQLKSLERMLKSVSDFSDRDKVEEDLRAMNTIVTVYEYMINRANSEVSAAKEYLMSIKKIWDRRRSVEGSVPISEKNYKIPEYDFNKSGKAYIS